MTRSIIFSYGKDDIIKYGSPDFSKAEYDISLYEDSYFRENSLYVYTSKELTENLLLRTEEPMGANYKNAPYLFTEADNIIKGTTQASSVILPYSASSPTQLYYSDSTNEYLYYKDGNRKVDLLSGKNISYKNVFILFADTTTYEKANGTELVVDTLSGGQGYYISCGYKTEIRWCITESGELEFKTLSGEKLIVNRGNAYIGYYKASKSHEIVIQ